MTNIRQVEAICQDCGNTVLIPINVKGRWKRCRECFRKKDNLRKKEFDQRKREERMLQPTRPVTEMNIGGEYHITKDPDQSWGEDSSFTWDEVERMLVAQYLLVGTEFRIDPNPETTHRVIFEKGNLVLRLISEIAPSPIKIPVPPPQKPKLIPYWKRKNTWRHSMNV